MIARALLAFAGLRLKSFHLPAASDDLGHRREHLTPPASPPQPQNRGARHRGPTAIGEPAAIRRRATMTGWPLACGSPTCWLDSRSQPIWASGCRRKPRCAPASSALASLASSVARAGGGRHLLRQPALSRRLQRARARDDRRLGDDLTVGSAAARTNFADRGDLLRTMIPEATSGMPPLARARAAAFLIARGKDFGKRFDTGSCEVARETARRIGLGEGVRRGLYAIHEWWNGDGAPRGLGEEIALPARIARLATDAALFNDLGDSSWPATRWRNGRAGCSTPSGRSVSRQRIRAPSEVAAHDPRRAGSWRSSRSRYRKGGSELPRSLARSATSSI